MRSGGRVVEGARLESVYTATPYRGFESLPLRHLPRPGLSIAGHLRGIAERERPSERAQRPCRDQELPRNQTCYVEYPLRGRHRIPASPAPTASSRGAVRDYARGPDPIAPDGRPVAGLTASGICGPLR